MAGTQTVSELEHVPEHPYLSRPILYVGYLAAHVTDDQLAKALEFCVPFRPRLVRDQNTGVATGSIEFRTLDKAEKALVTVNDRPIPNTEPPALLQLNPEPVHPGQRTQWPRPAAAPRLVTNLPPNFAEARLFDTFRVFGPLATTRMQPNMGNDVALIEFWREEDAKRAEEVMHCSEIDEFNISVKVFTPQAQAAARKQEFNVAAAPFVPGFNNHIHNSPHIHSPHIHSPHLHQSPRFTSMPSSPLQTPHSPQAVLYSPPRAPLQYPRSPSMSPFMHGPGQQVQFAPPSGPGSTSASGLIDPCNLFCKNLDPEIDSNALFAHFKRFGQIVSARVMRTEQGFSRGFGFVSFQTPEQASKALQAMNGVTLGSKQIVVRLHEPKQLRKEKLAQRYSSGTYYGNGHPRSGSGATSPSLSEGGESVTAAVNWGPGHPDRPRRSSGSYYAAALAGNLNLPMRYEDLNALTPVVRREVLSGEYSRRLRNVEGVKDSEIDQIVALLVAMPLDDVVSGLQSFSTFQEQVHNVKADISKPRVHVSHVSPVPLSYPDIQPPQVHAPAPAIARSTSTSSSLLDPNNALATASAPEHPSTPVSFTPSMNTPPRSASPAGSIAQGTEKDRLLAAVSRLEPNATKAADLTEMLLSLSKKERAMCLFSADYLRSKVETARGILDTLEEEDEPVALPRPAPPQRAATVPETPQPKRPVPTSDIQSPPTPDLSSRGPSAAASPAAPVTPVQSQNSNAVHTLSTLARLPAGEIIKLANSSHATGLPLPKADPLVVKSTDEFVDSLEGKPSAQQKQLLGEKLFKCIKSFGVKNAPKLTIALLDTEDLRALSHLMNSYPSVLKEKVLQQTVAK